MQWKYAALAALVAGGAYVGADALRGDAENPDIRTGAADPAPEATAAEAVGAAPVTQAAVAAPPASDPASAPTGIELRLAAAEAERDQLRAALDAASAERDALAAAFAERETAAAAAPGDALPDGADAAGAAATDPATEIERLLADLAGQAAEIDRLKVEIAARDVELDALRASAVFLPAPGEPEILPPALIAAPATVVLAAAPAPEAAATSAATFAARLEAAKSGLPLPRPVADSANVATAPGEPPLALVLFERGSARLTTGAAERAGAAAATLAALNPGLIRVTGHSDTTGSPTANMRLSRARAEAVAAALVAAGLPADRIEIAALGQEFDALPILTGDGVAEPLNRSASIYAFASAE